MKLLKKVGLVVLIVALIFFGRSSLGSTTLYVVDQFSSVIIYPVLRIAKIVAMPFEYVGSWWKLTGALEKEVASLRDKVDTLRTQNISFRASQAHWDDIKELVDYKNRNHQQEIIAPVILTALTESEHSILVDAGSYHGVKANMVAVNKNILVGRVAEVFPFYSKVFLITDRRCRVPARCSNTKTQGVHQGDNVTHQAQLNFVSHLEKIEPSDTVLTSGQGLIFPPGLGLGVIEKVEKDQLGVNWVIGIKPFLDSKHLKAVSLIKR